MNDRLLTLYLQLLSVWRYLVIAFNSIPALIVTSDPRLGPECVHILDDGTRVVDWIMVDQKKRERIEAMVDFLSPPTLPIRG